MAKIDRLREEIGWLKIVFGLLVAIDASLLGWLAQNYTTASRLLVLADAAGCCCDCRCCAGQSVGVPSDRAIGGSVMVWVVIAALAIMVAGLLLVVREAEQHGR